MFNVFIFWIGISIYILFSLTHILTSIINPGLPSEEYFLENFKIEEHKTKEFAICQKCKIVADLTKGVEHCIFCDICITSNDHHCPWTSKCIGENNQILFNIFIRLFITHILFLFFSFISLLLNKIN